MGETGFLELVIRSIVSLGIVLAFIAMAYMVAKRRASGGSSRQRGHGLARLSSPKSSKRGPARLETIARVGLSRGSVAIAVRFGDQVVLLGVADGSPISVLQEMPAERWDELSETEHLVSTSVLPERTDSDGAGVVVRPTFVEALREATVRRA